MAFSPTEANADFEQSSLLCNEDTCTCFFDEADGVNTNASQMFDDCSCHYDEDDAYNLQKDMSEHEDLASGLQRSLSELFERENHYLPQADFVLSATAQSSRNVDASSRRQAVSWILKMRGFFRFSAYTVSLSINYFDRFLSLHQLPTGKAWTLQLLSVTCLSLAAKMEEIDAPLLLDLQVGADLVFEPRTIQRMELLVLSTLGWKLSSVTPISYTSYFIIRLDSDIRTKQALTLRVNELIFSCALEIRFLRFLPSSIAAAATLCALQEILPLQVAEQKRYLLNTMPHQSQVCSPSTLDLWGN
ncbi:hypothetical protein KP509_35G003500 [Ceratopteris richardii]|uniref:Cyclin-like domain-containing protein n=1 Tax=Ceratopteris richardii TaxID=49495 RepID=A0A8T2QER0_CERRI|nr:hypothetical protein KP509_35G003500 [Ceratopteris richardii]